jgi:hypothetical protein
MAVSAPAQLAILAVVILVSPGFALAGVKAVLTIAGCSAICSGTHFFLWPRSNRASWRPSGL